jgi:exosortase
VLLLGFLYASTSVELVSDWYADPDYSHGFIVPVVFLWLLWERRKALQTCPLAPQGWALGIVALGILQLYVGRLGAEYFVAHTSLLVMLAGIALYLFGWPLLRKVAFPVAWLLFMIPLPAILFYAITFPMQLLASRMASRFLDLLSVTNLREGNVIYLPHFSMGVAQACSGITSLITLLAFTVFLGYFLRLRLWTCWVLIASAVPVALVTNATRIAGAGLIGNYYGAQWAEGFFHAFEGWVLFLVAALIIGGLGVSLRKLERRRISGAAS